MDGTRIIRVRRRNVEVGPIDSQVDDEIEAVLISEDQAICLSNSDISEEYVTYVRDLFQNQHLPETIEKYLPEKLIPDTSPPVSPKNGEFIAGIDRISGSGNGIIELTNSHINIGPVNSNSEGKIIKGKIIDSRYARCMTNNVIDGQYDRKLKRLIPSSNKYNSDEKISICGKCGVLLQDQNTKCRCISGPEEVISLADILGEQATEIKDDSVADSNELNSSNKLDEKPSDKSGENHKDSDENKNIDQLRKEAEADSKKRVSSGQETTVESTRYSRSSKIRQYVLARADGYCEGCEEPAPFTSKTGDPYLHAHHIHELSEGGSDTPDTVIALCPNCHYRVHHGEDGDEYNSKLTEKLDQVE